MTSALAPGRGYTGALVAELPSGILTVAVERSDFPPADLFSFAARDNPKRAFLFLSKVLGKHLPVSPQAMRAVHLRLAAKIPALPQPVLFIGMAETATGLGQGVFEAWLAGPGRREGLFFGTSRYKAANATQLQFEESHSHAPVQFLNLPVDPALSARLVGSRSVVLVDDEISTGDTLVNLAVSLRRVAPLVAGAHIVSLTDFMGVPGRASLTARIGLPTSFGSLLEGNWSFDATAHGALPGRTSAPAQGVPAVLADGGFGRLGISHALRLPDGLVEELAGPMCPGSRVLVLGTGEFMHAAFVLGRALDQIDGISVDVHATTRSPILAWGDVGKACKFEDNYGERIPNYLYSNPAQYDHVLLCHETPVNPALVQLAARIGARLIHFIAESPVAECSVR